MRRGWGGLVAFLLLAALVSPTAAVARTSNWHTLGRDKAGDQEPAYIDVTGMRVRQRGDHLLVRFEFRDLPPTYAPGARVGAHLSIDGGRRWCCFLRGDLGPLQEHSMSYEHREARGPCEEDPKCRPCTPLEGRYDAERDRLTLFLPLEEVGFESGDVLTGCSADEGASVCRSASGVYTSPTFGMYGYDVLRVTNPYVIR